MTNALPTTMTAIELKQPGGPEMLVPGQRPVPRPGNGEVLIKVEAAAINRPDVLQRQGKYPPPPGAPDTLGLDVAGIVAAAAPDVAWPKVGDKVCALVAGGGYAEYAVAPAPQCLPVPKGLSMAEAASLPETYFTVWTNVFDRGRLQSGEIFLVHGGASGIGTTAIQLARALGSRVFATAGSAEKCAACEGLGAEKAVNYKTEDWVDIVRKASGGEGVDVILDMVGGDYTPRNLELLRTDGRVVQIAFLRGNKTQIDLNPIMRKRLTLTGSTLRPRSVAEKAEIAQSLRAKVWPLFETGKLKPVIHAKFPLAKASDAHAMMDADQHTGKIVLTVV
jgi:putative PIG3 family NAD(P)H quinone oxidoreductase